MPGDEGRGKYTLNQENTLTILLAACCTRETEAQRLHRLYENQEENPDVLMSGTVFSQQGHTHPAFGRSIEKKG